MPSVQGGRDGYVRFFKNREEVGCGFRTGCHAYQRCTKCSNEPHQKVYHGYLQLPATVGVFSGVVARKQPGEDSEGSVSFSIVAGSSPPPGAVSSTCYGPLPSGWDSFGPSPIHAFGDYVPHAESQRCSRTLFGEPHPYRPAQSWYFY